MKAPTAQTIKRLFALSKNRCAFSGCTTAISQPSGTLTGKICHIKGQKPNAARYDSTQSDEERHVFENLILLCGVHHDIVDNELQTYTVERLKKLKETHEQSGDSQPIQDDASVRKLIDEYLRIEARQSPKVSLEFEFVMETWKEERFGAPLSYEKPKISTGVFLKIYAKNHRGGLAKIIQGFVWIPEQFLIEVMVNRGIQPATTPEEMANGQLEKIEVSNKLADAPIHQFAKRPPPDWKPILSGMSLCVKKISVHHSCWGMLNKIPGSILWQISADDSDAIEGETKFTDIPFIDQSRDLK